MVKGKVEVVPFSNDPFIRPALVMEDDHYRCQRCGHKFRMKTDQLVYCTACAQFGRVTIHDGLYNEPVLRKETREVQCAWQGQLTIWQQQVATQLVEGVQAKIDQLVWAVTGSGKTEMIFPVIKQVLSTGGRVVVASPRIDVCRELFPRINAAFPREKPILLYGQSEEPYRFTSLVVCTTHQLIHFYRCFDLVIIDEADAFPYEGDPYLRYAQEQAVSNDGTRIFLTATPSKYLVDSLAPNTCTHTLAKRFHGRLLPVPQLYFYSHWENIDKNRTIKKLLALLKKLASEQFTLVFCPSIALVDQVYDRLTHVLSDYTIEKVSAKTAERKEIVLKARNHAYHILVTTTILERGVTFDAVSVVVLSADHVVYSKSALVQIAGRVDRKGSEATGEVWFLYRRKTSAIKEAIREIKHMNQTSEDLS